LLSLEKIFEKNEYNLEICNIDDIIENLKYYNIEVTNLLNNIQNEGLLESEKDVVKFVLKIIENQDKFKDIFNKQDVKNNLTVEKFINKKTLTLTNS